MASATNLHVLSTCNRGEVYVENISQEAANRVSELLMQNHEKFHILFHGRGLHSKSHLLLAGFMPYISYCEF
jgi:glutamyl-tRNA reductase